MPDDKVTRALRLSLDCDWTDLGTLEHEGSLLWPATLQRRKADGSLAEVAVMLRPLSNAQRFRARVRAREWAARLKLDLDRDKDFVEDLENYECLAFAIRDPKPPYDQHVIDGPALFDAHSTASLATLWSRLNQLTEVMDPRYGDLSAEELWRVAAAVAHRGEPSPLAGMPGFAQATWLVLMARAACSSPSAPSLLRSLSTSALGSSTSAPERPSSEEETGARGDADPVVP
jgi:hypothetical protein